MIWANREQILEVARAVKECGATGLRGGAFKPRTSPYSFQGLKEKGLELLALAREETGLAIVTEVMAPEHVPLVSKYADILQVGARNMQNYPLLEAVGEANLPVLLKRGASATMEEFLLAAEYQGHDVHVVYSGEVLEEAADIIPKWALCEGNNIGFRLSSKSPDQGWITRIDGKDPKGPFFPRKFSSHRDEAIFAIQGPCIRSGAVIDRARIIDVAPTILKMLGVGIPAEMDGRVLEELFEAASVEQRNEALAAIAQETR